MATPNNGRPVSPHFGTVAFFFTYWIVSFPPGVRTLHDCIIENTRMMSERIVRERRAQKLECKSCIGVSGKTAEVEQSGP